jgi:hypothetical protein
VKEFVRKWGFERETQLYIRRPKNDGKGRKSKEMFMKLKIKDVNFGSIHTPTLSSRPRGRCVLRNVNLLQTN